MKQIYELRKDLKQAQKTMRLFNLATSHYQKISDEYIERSIIVSSLSGVEESVKISIAQKIGLNENDIIG